MLHFDEKHYQTEKLELEGRTIEFRAFRDVVYVGKPVDVQHQKMNIFVPEVYYHGGNVGRYTAETAPTFVPNLVGGYMPGEVDEPGYVKFGPKQLNSVFAALEHGYIVATPAARGRSLKDEDGKNVGKAPALVVDMKAAVRFLRYIADKIPGDQEKIITNGTSAGGALSSIMGATGNHPDYAPYLAALEAADTRDDIFAASCYCPITNLEHADMAYEWQFAGVYDFHRMNMSMEEGGRPKFSPVDGRMTEKEIQVSKEEAKLFPAYVNSLHLKGDDGQELTLDEKGEGSFKKYIEKQVLSSAQKALNQGRDLSDKKWLTIKKAEGSSAQAASMDFASYVVDITRMKNAPAFDALDLQSPENDEFGTEQIDALHFTDYSQTHGNGEKAQEAVIRMLNPMCYLDDDKAVKTTYWRIRHGSCDRDTSLAISAILALSLQEKGCKVDYHLPWGLPHSGDYDLPELFAWIDEIC